jgi:hypothetical protein
MRGLETVDPGASGMMHESGDTLAAHHGHASGGHMVKRPLLLGVVTCRTSAPSVKHMVRANVPSGGPVGMALDEVVSAAIAVECLRECTLCCLAWLAFDFRPTEGKASGTRRTRRTLTGEKQP